MAEVADLHHHHLPQEEEIETLGSAPYWYSFCDHDDDDDIYSSYEPDPDEFDPFSPLNFDSFDHSLHTQIIFDERETCVELVGSDDDDEEEEGSDSDSILEHDNQVNIVFNLFERSNQEEDETHVIDGDYDNRFRIFDENDEMGANYIELGLGVNREIGDLSDDDGNSGFTMEEFGGDNYHVSRRDTGESSDVRHVETFGDGGLRVVGIGSDSDDEEDGIFGIGFHSGEEEDDDGFDCSPEDLGLQLCWESLRLEEDQRESNEEFEWEEVDERGDEREVMNMVIDAEVRRRLVLTEMLSGQVGEGGGETMTRTLEWEVLLAVNNLDRNVELEHEGDHDGYIYPAEYETLFGQVAEHDSFIRGNPPAARTVVDNLSSVVVTQDVENNGATCAVCKDEMGMEEQVKKLPCCHCYHGDCILPWLGIRNTCPVCRYELPTDDPDYERMRTRRAVDRGVSRDDHDQPRKLSFKEN